MTAKQNRERREAVMQFEVWLLDQVHNGVDLGSFEDLQATFIAGQLSTPEVRRLAAKVPKYIENKYPIECRVCFNRFINMETLEEHHNRKHIKFGSFATWRPQ